ncbi:type II protein geranylgeranyltransferase beta subunit [Fimicolochytrium jonesii]|uniref:type II protein geranylgeranyltransferase beta subunit n=1 Tax=Fimicolochytrium jonesii TaxID=1396493 RepID=UPI0022FEEFE5|nr:type II protein geranylgeranyltransferase beta subunit [Fimicolochytrium jonesii]KAI8818925.1 type II protein geranylgeranyltransferase beta subunit [Fimicolochytrium jonesii]
MTPPPTQPPTTASASKAPELLLDLHVNFIVNLDKNKDVFEYWASDQLRLNGVYWALTALAFMSRPHELDREEVIAFVLSCQQKNGGFGGSVDHDAHLIYTLSAIQILVTLDALERVDVERVVSYILTLHDPVVGSFTGDEWGETDTRFSYCAISALSLMGRLDAVDGDKVAEFIDRCRNFDGGYGTVPGAESHAGQIFCCVGTLAILNHLHLVERDKLCWWLAERQLPNGGLNGRPEKLEDVCYSWWVLSALAILDRIHWINKETLAGFILASQDTETGGIADRPGDIPDVFHTVFGLAGLSLLEFGGLVEVDPRYCMPRGVTRRVGL